MSEADLFTACGVLVDGEHRGERYLFLLGHKACEVLGASALDFPSWFCFTSVESDFPSSHRNEALPLLQFLAVKILLRTTNAIVARSYY